MLKRVKPVVVKEFRQIRRDKRSLGVLLVLPAFIIVMIGYALNFDVRHVSTAVLDNDRTATSRTFIDKFRTSRYFDIDFVTERYEDIEEMLDKGEVAIVIVIPADFSDDLARGDDASVQILLDGSNANTAATIGGYVRGIVQSYSTVSVEVVKKPFIPIDLRPRIWYNPELSSAKFLVPGMIGFILMITGVVSTSLSVVAEKERGTMEQLLVSPLRMIEIVIGKLLPYLIISFISTMLVVIMGIVLFDVTVKGSFILLFAGISLFLICALGQGLFISTIARTQQVAFMLSVFSSLLPTFLLSGFVFPIKSMPVFLQIVSNVTPAKFFLSFCRSVILKGSGISMVWENMLYMVIFASVMLGLSSLRLVRREH